MALPAYVDEDWLEDHVDCSNKELLDMLGPGCSEITQIMPRYRGGGSNRTKVEIQAALDLFPDWGAYPLELATGRSRFSWYGIMRAVGNGAKFKYTGKAKARTPLFWPVWRQYVQDHIEDFRPIAHRIVLYPGIRVEDCADCSYKTAFMIHSRRRACDSRYRLPCENYMLWDAINDATATQHNAVP